MIYISAQPDLFYFLWQLQLQLFNFNRLGINSTQIHVLICYDKERGLSPYFQSFIKENKQAQFFIYPDTRKSKLYDSSIRPHIIAKHFKANPWLENEAIFYHDSDIIFTQLPDFNQLLQDNIWYASDTRSYNDSHYIKNKIGVVGFKGMAKLIGVSHKVIEEHDDDTGGAQYLLKKITVKFWQRLEKDCEAMFEYLNDLNNQLTSIGSTNDKIQAWCTDMWCLRWQAIKRGEKVKIHQELDFMWAYTPIATNLDVKILHYTGNIKEAETKYFKKNNYGCCAPFFDDFGLIERTSASGILVEEIKKYNQYQLQNRIDLTDVSFLIPIRVDSVERLENLRIVTNYLHQQFKTNIIILEADSEQKVDVSKLPNEVNYHFITDDQPLFHRTKYNNRLITLSSTPIVSLYDTDVVLPIGQITASIDILRRGLIKMAYPYDGTFVSIDRLMKAMFSKHLDISLLEGNKGKHIIATRRSYGGCVFLDKESFLNAGGDNENLTSWGPDNMERKRRMQNLGYKIERIEGMLYHLPHPKSTNSGYDNLQQCTTLMDEYFKICSMMPAELKNYINAWSWRYKLGKAI